jgi:hypothetical protein
VQGAALDIPQLALSPPLNASAARAGDRAAEALAADLVNAIALYASKMMGAELRTVEAIPAAWFAFPGESVALRRNRPPGHHRRVPSRQVLFVPAAEIFSKSRHPQTTFLHGG